MLGTEKMTLDARRSKGDEADVLWTYHARPSTAPVDDNRVTSDKEALVCNNADEVIFSVLMEQQRLCRSDAAPHENLLLCENRSRYIGLPQCVRK